METLSQLIKELRAFGLTQEQVAEETGLSQAHVSNVENEKRGARTPAETLERVRVVRDRYRAESEDRSADKGKSQA